MRIPCPASRAKVGHTPSSARAPRVALLPFFLSLLPLAIPAQAEQNMLDYLSPRGGSRGQTLEIKIHGRELKDTREVLFYQPGLKAVNIPPGAKPAESVKVKIEI